MILNKNKNNNNNQEVFLELLLAAKKNFNPLCLAGIVGRVLTR